MSGRIIQPKDVAKLGTILGVWAHPDDETYGCAGLMAQAVKNDQRVVCLTATRGEAGSQDEAKWPKGTIAKVRTSELNRALDILGVTEHHWLDYPDGGCKDIPDQVAVDTIAGFIKEVKPDTILTFEPNGITGHDDHRAISRWTSLARAKTNSKAKLYYYIGSEEEYNDVMREADKQFNIFFNTDKPVLVPRSKCDIALQLSPVLHGQKIKALKAMPSQTEVIFSSDLRHELARVLEVETFVLAGNYK